MPRAPANGERTKSWRAPATITACSFDYSMCGVPTGSGAGRLALSDFISPYKNDRYAT
jgi:hypothetical protein